MSASDLSTEAAPEPVPAGLVEAGVYRTQADGFDHGLVVLAMGEPYWLVPEGESYRLLVESRALATVRQQLVCFDRESIGWPPRPPGETHPGHRAELVTPLLWSLVIFTVFWGQGEWPGLVDAGSLDVRAVFDRGEWWRIGTALFLHADVGHVVSNALSGILVFSAVLSTLGRRLGWLLVAVAALAGNLAVASMYYPHNYRSIGASTAIFAGFGLLTGRAIRAVGRGSERRQVRAMFVRLGAGLTILGLYGAGAAQVDVLAHVGGFVAGLVFGFLAAPSRKPAAHE